LRTYINSHVALPHIYSTLTAFEHHSSTDPACSVSTNPLSEAHRIMGNELNSANAIVSNLAPLDTPSKSGQTKPFGVEHLTELKRWRVP